MRSFFSRSNGKGTSRKEDAGVKQTEGRQKDTTSKQAKSFSSLKQKSLRHPESSHKRDEPTTDSLDKPAAKPSHEAYTVTSNGAAHKNTTESQRGKTKFENPTRAPRANRCTKSEQNERAENSQARRSESSNNFAENSWVRPSNNGNSDSSADKMRQSSAAQSPQLRDGRQKYDEKQVTDFILAQQHAYKQLQQQASQNQHQQPREEQLDFPAYLLEENVTYGQQYDYSSFHQDGPHQNRFPGDEHFYERDRRVMMQSSHSPNEDPVDEAPQPVEDEPQRKSDSKQAARDYRMKQPGKPLEDESRGDHCQVCFDTIEPYLGQSCNRGSDKFCHTCVRKYIENFVYGELYEMRTSEDGFRVLACPAVGCETGYISHDMVQNIVNPETWERYQEKIFRFTFTEDDEPIVNPPAPRPPPTPVEKKPPPVAKKSTAAVYSQKNEHVSYSNKEPIDKWSPAMQCHPCGGNDAIMNQLAEALTEAKVRRCPSCGTPFLKEDGFCNKMRCPSCRAHMCYVCGAPVPKKGYEHFCIHNYDRCKQGCGKCVLWTTQDDKVDREMLRVVATEEANKITEQRLLSGKEFIPIDVESLVLGFEKQQSSRSGPAISGLKMDPPTRQMQLWDPAIPSPPS